MTAYAAGRLPWGGMRLEDYFDAVLFLAAGGVVPAASWVDDLRAAAAARSLEGFT